MISPCLLLVAALAGDPYEDASLAAMDVWGDWAARRILAADEAGMYKPRAAVDSRILLFSGRKNSEGKLVKKIKKTCKVFDKLVPRPEDDEEHTAHTIVLLGLDNTAGVATVTEFLGERYEYLSSWASAGGQRVGFVIEEPIVAAWVHEAPELEEWNPENELVNRLARSLLVERHGRMPHWVSMGLAWHVELTQCKDIWCFPDRAGFVGKKEHKGWSRALVLMMAERADQPLTIEQLAGWARGTYDDERAALAWGALTMLTKHYPKELRAVLSAFAEVRRTDGRTVHDDGTWELVPDYEIPAERQLEILDETLGIDFMVELGRWCTRGGKGYRRPR